MFYFQQLFNTAMSGIDSGGATAGAVQVAQYILLASLLFDIYEAWARGGDTHFLGATAVRFFAVGLVMVNYGTVSRHATKSASLRRTGRRVHGQAASNARDDRRNNPSGYPLPKHPGTTARETRTPIEGLASCPFAITLKRIGAFIHE